MTRLHVKRLALTDFRTYAHVKLALDDRPVVLFGTNGAGKTNLLEALSMLAPGRGLRRAKLEAPLRRTGEASTDSWAVFAEIGTSSGETHRLGAGVQADMPGRRTVKLDGEAASASDLGGLLPMIWLTPVHDRLFAGGKSERRRFLDRFVLAARPGHARAAGRYERAMRERQKLLDEGGFDPAWLEGLEREMAARGAEIALGRAETLARLAAAMHARPDDAFPKADMRLDGEMETAFADGGGMEAIETDFAERLADARRLDGAAGRALNGPHRTDLVVHHKAKSAPAGDCSTGEQKALVLGLALAHAAALEAHEGGAPVALFDEACAHLDAERRAALADTVCALPGQIWLTGVEAGLFRAFGGRAQGIEVSDGAVKEVDL